MEYKPMLAATGSISDLSKRMIFEPKLDGTRVLIFKDGEDIKLVNRRGVNIAYRYPEIRPISNIKAEKAVLDGELVVFDKKGRPNFYLLAEREHIDSRFKIKIRSKLFPATLVIFDILSIDEKDLTHKPLHERKGLIKKYVVEDERIKICPWTENGKKLWRNVCKLGLEGVMAKAIDSPYVFERSDYWLKIKRLQTLDAVIAGWTSDKRDISSLIVGGYKKGRLIYLGKIGTGFSDKDIDFMLPLLKKMITKKCPFKEIPELNLPKKRDVFWVKPALVCEVKFMHLSPEGVMRAPVFLRLRNDKKAEDCILDEI